ncbi:hypothetical protein BDZ94DRAFT_198335 [Collybia nuda]|uniref:G domain-containing protein n=1 Tax=Collybia nuda TaxID=64659 RepID=A0A9P5XXN7_9AGAR|nr:hypothetical protein BDZ94DRAFT_198335 [Collybia nuda]
MPLPDVAVPSGRARLRVMDIILKTNTPLKWAEVKVLVVGSLVLQQKRKLPECPEAKFTVFRNLPPSQLVLQINYPYFGVSKTINVKGMDLLSSHKRDIGEKRAWQQSFGKLELVVEFEYKDGLNEVGRPLSQPSMAGDNITTACEAQSTKDTWLPITDHILGTCPQFRILVIGKPGAGISALINEVFGTTYVIGSHDHERPSIDCEIQPEGNPYLLLHYAPYIEPDSDNAIQIIQNFIKHRSQLPDVKERLHAIWVFVEIPITCVPLMEPGLEKFLDRMKKEGLIPNFIVIFTKFDRLVDMERYSMIQAGQAKPTFDVTWGYAKSRFISEHIFPFEGRMGKAISHLFVSVYDQYRATLCELIELTLKIVVQHILEAAIVLGISQKISASVKIRICVKLGVENYWREQEIVHNEIVKVWNFDDGQNVRSHPFFLFYLLIESPTVSVFP